MLLSLHVKNLALIEEEEVTFTDGLNILTGETGAGKSIIIGSINMALGARADRSVIRTGAEYALIELTFSADNPRQLEKLRELGLTPEPSEYALDNSASDDSASDNSASDDSALGEYASNDSAGGF